MRTKEVNQYREQSAWLRTLVQEVASQNEVELAKHES